MGEERVFQFDVGAAVARYFDDSSLAGDRPLRLVLLSGGVAAGKTTRRKQLYSSGYVLVDADEIFWTLSRGEYFTFPEVLTEPMELVGRMVAERAIAERRHIVTEMVGGNAAELEVFIHAMEAAGYTVEIDFVSCDIEQALQWNRDRGDDCISAFYAGPFQFKWLISAAGDKLADERALQ